MEPTTLTVGYGSSISDSLVWIARSKTNGESGRGSFSRYGIKHRGKHEFDGARPESFFLPTTVHQSVLDRDQQDWRTVTVSPADIVASVRE